MSRFKTWLGRPAAKILLALVLAGCLCLYLWAFFTPGIRIYGSFLPRVSRSPELCYTGQASQGTLSIRILEQPPDYQVTYQLPDGRTLDYLVRFGDGQMGQSPVTVEDSSEGTLLFEGIYQPGSPFLFGSDGTPLPGNDVIITTGEEDPAATPPSPEALVFLCRHEYDAIRGNPVLALAGILILAITLLDWRFPRLFFLLSHGLSVQDPQPSDLYLSIQRFTWKALPAVAVILLLAALVIPLG